MSYIDNTNNISENYLDDESMVKINQSSYLDNIAKKLRQCILANNSDASILKGSYNKTRFNDMVGSICLLFNLIKIANNKPIYLITDHYDSDYTSGYYFFVGTYDNVKDRLLKLYDDRNNRMDANDY